MASNASDAACSPPSLGTLRAVHPRSHVCRTSLTGSAPERAGTLFSSGLRLSFVFFFFFETGSHDAALADLPASTSALGLKHSATLAKFLFFLFDF